ncbi:MAG TPA: PilZ domain-containing protein [Roseiarcus sp.]|jgi:hypothetical protein|nr:PilZ domain-containing protein [Roseiarcus sp.]
MIERRRVRRQKSLLRGTLYFDKKRGMMSCLVRDVSAEGARIIFSEAVVIPGQVTLHIPQREQTWLAHVEWRRGDEIGLSFAAAEPEAVPPKPAEVTDRMTQLEGEIGALKRKLRRIRREKQRDDDLGAA